MLWVGTGYSGTAGYISNRPGPDIVTTLDLKKDY